MQHSSAPSRVGDKRSSDETLANPHVMKRALVLKSVRPYLLDVQLTFPSSGITSQDKILVQQLVSEYMSSVCMYDTALHSIVTAERLAPNCILVLLMNVDFCAIHQQPQAIRSLMLRVLACHKKEEDHMTKYELLYITAYRCWCHVGDLSGAFDAFCDIVEQYPWDVFACKRAQLCAFLLGGEFVGPRMLAPCLHGSWFREYLCGEGSTSSSSSAPTENAEETKKIDVNPASTPMKSCSAPSKATYQSPTVTSHVPSKGLVDAVRYFQGMRRLTQRFRLAIACGMVSFALSEFAKLRTPAIPEGKHDGDALCDSKVLGMAFGMLGVALNPDDVWSVHGTIHGAGHFVRSDYLTQDGMRSAEHCMAFMRTHALFHRCVHQMDQMKLLWAGKQPQENDPVSLCTSFDPPSPRTHSGETDSVHSLKPSLKPSAELKLTNRCLKPLSVGVTETFIATDEERGGRSDRGTMMQMLAGTRDKPFKHLSARMCQSWPFESPSGIQEMLRSIRSIKRSLWSRCDGLARFEGVRCMVHCDGKSEQAWLGTSPCMLQCVMQPISSGHFQYASYQNVRRPSPGRFPPCLRHTTCHPVPSGETDMERMTAAASTCLLYYVRLELLEHVKMSIGDVERAAGVGMQCYVSERREDARNQQFLNPEDDRDKYTTLFDVVCIRKCRQWILRQMEGLLQRLTHYRDCSACREPHAGCTLHVSCVGICMLLMSYHHGYKGRYRYNRLLRLRLHSWMRSVFDKYISQKTRAHSLQVPKKYSAPLLVLIGTAWHCQLQHRLTPEKDEKDCHWSLLQFWAYIIGGRGVEDECNSLAHLTGSDEQVQGIREWGLLIMWNCLVRGRGFICDNRQCMCHRWAAFTASEGSQSGLWLAETGPDFRSLAMRYWSTALDRECSAYARLPVGAFFQEWRRYGKMRFSEPS